MSILIAFHPVLNIHRHFGNCKWAVSKIYTHPFNRKLVIKAYVESHYEKPEKQRNFYIWINIFFKWREVFQSSLDCFPIQVWAFIQNIYFFIFIFFFVYWCQFVATFKCFSLKSQIWIICSKDINPQYIRNVYCRE